MVTSCKQKLSTPCCSFLERWLWPIDVYEKVDCSLALPACLLLLAYVASCSSCYEAHFGALCRGSVLICPWIQCLAAGLPTKANQQSISLRCLCIDHTMSIIIPTYICYNRFYCRDPCHEKSWSWVCFPSFLSFCTIFILNYSTT